MKTVIQDNSGYTMYAEVEKIEMSRDNEYVLRFSTTYDQSRNPNNDRTVAQFILRRNEIAVLTNLLASQIG
jgi:hypothetical protein